MSRKIVLIGAGSASFTQGLVMDLLTETWSEPWELWLVDVEKTVLDAVTALCRKMIVSRGKEAEIRLFASTDRKDALPGANFVVSTIGVGGRRAWEQDVFIPRKYGVYQPVGDSVAPGGISRAMRMIPAVVAIAKDIEVLCPQAFFFNYANPMSAICRAVRLETGVPVIGLCHGVKNGLRRIARFAGLPQDKVTGYSIGINHFVVIYQLYCDGKIAWDAVRDAIGRVRAGTYEGKLETGPLSHQFFTLYGAYPASDDRHYSEFTQSYFAKDAYFGKTLGVDAYSFEETIRGGDETYDEMFALAASQEPLPASFFQRFEGEHEQLMEIIQSILYDKRQVFMINAPNQGSVASLPGDAILEMPAVAGVKGFIPMVIQDFPAVFTGLLSKHIAIGELTVHAALHGDREAFAEAIFQGGYLSDRAQAQAMAGEMIEAQKQYLPQF